MHVETGPIRGRTGMNRGCFDLWGPRTFAGLWARGTSFGSLTYTASVPGPRLGVWSIDRKVALVTIVSVRPVDGCVQKNSRLSRLYISSQHS